MHILSLFLKNYIPTVVRITKRPINRRFISNWPKACNVASRASNPVNQVFHNCVSHLLVAIYLTFTAYCLTKSQRESSSSTTFCESLTLRWTYFKAVSLFPFLYARLKLTFISADRLWSPFLWFASVSLKSPQHNSYKFRSESNKPIYSLLIDTGIISSLTIARDKDMRLSWFVKMTLPMRNTEGLDITRVSGINSWRKKRKREVFQTAEISRQKEKCRHIFLKISLLFVLLKHIVHYFLYVIKQ